MQSLIIGSGLIGLFAKEMIGGNILPFNKSRYFSFTPSLADDFIKCDSDIDGIVNNLHRSIPIFHKLAFSLKGTLITEPEATIVEAYLNKAYNGSPPFLADVMMKKMGFFTHGTSCGKLYELLLRKHNQNIHDSVGKYGRLLKIKPHVAVCERANIEFDTAISTIPLDVLCKLAGISVELHSGPIYYYHIKTGALNFEGADQVLVTDQHIDFFKVSKISDIDYVFWSPREIEMAHSYFGAFMNKFSLDNITHIQNVIPFPKEPHSKPPDLDWLWNDYGIHCVGSNAQWDDLMDVSSCLKRLQRLAKTP